MSIKALGLFIKLIKATHSILLRDLLHTVYRWTDIYQLIKGSLRLFVNPRLKIFPSIEMKAFKIDLTAENEKRRQGKALDPIHSRLCAMKARDWGPLTLGVDP
jgi:hypothetical protein